jgi:hypothetical protein
VTDDLDRLIAEAARAHDPLPGTKDRVWARVSAKVAASAAALPWAVGGGLVAIAAVIAALALGSSDAPPEPAVPARIEVPDAGVHSPVVVPRAEPAVVEPPVVEPPVAPPASEPAPPPSPRARPEPRSPAETGARSEGPSPPPGDDTAADEPSAEAPSDGAALLLRAQAELRRGDARAALATAAEHQRAHPRSRLALERTTIEALAHCALGDAASARARAAAVFAEAPDGPAARRLRASCVGEP